MISAPKPKIHISFCRTHKNIALVVVDVVCTLSVIVDVIIETLPVSTSHGKENDVASHADSP